MISKFLNAKHWQLFSLLFGIPLISQLIIMGISITQINTGTAPNPQSVQTLFLIFPIIVLLFMGVFMGWFWSVAIGLQKVIPNEAKMNLKWFKIFFYIPIVYMTILSLFMSFGFNSFSQVQGDSMPLFIIIISTVIFPLHIFSMFCIFHSMFIVAKAFKTAEMQRKTSFSDFAGDFFLIWFYPIGVWIIQPKINKMVNGNSKSQHG